jgi:hypothetical protein
MSAPRTEPGPPPAFAAALASLPPLEQRVIRRWLAVHGLEVDELAAWPDLRRVVASVAVVDLARGDDGGRDPAFQRIAAALGLNGAAILRSWYRVQERALRQSVTGEGDQP